MPATATDFDEATPPPRTRPCGDPVPAYVTLPPGESLTGVFHDWDRKGRVAGGSVLCRFVGRPLDRPGHSGYVVEVLDPFARTPLGPVGTVIPAAAVEAYRVAVVVHAKGHGLFAVLSPLVGAGRE